MDSSVAVFNLSLVFYTTTCVACLAGISNFFICIVSRLHSLVVANLHFVSWTFHHTENAQSIGVKNKTVKLTLRRTPPRLS